ncbi:MAG TPA: helix-turn-helix transcriptional regulator [Solirubrobacteraceae bacterium]|jgi:transcriptional regulator with XRE-family HTH domain
MTIRSPAHAAFGQRIRAIRNRRGVSQEGLALQCGLDRTYISGIERGTRNPSLTNILKIATALDVDPSGLFVDVYDDPGEPLAK